MGRLFLSTFDGSPKCSARAWVEELDTYLQQHQVSKEAIQVVAMHLEGKAYAWWFYESSALKDANMSTYARFTRKLVKRFNEKHYETSLVELTKHTQTKPLHELEGSINPTPFQKTIEGIKKFHDTLLNATSPPQKDLSCQREDMEELNKEPLNDDEATSIHNEGEGKRRGNSVVTTVADLVPHE